MTYNETAQLWAAYKAAQASQSTGLNALPEIIFQADRVVESNAELATYLREKTAFEERETARSSLLASSTEAIATALRGLLDSMVENVWYRVRREEVSAYIAKKKGQLIERDGQTPEDQLS